MDRRSFVQNVGIAALSAFSSAAAQTENSAPTSPGKVLAIAAHPGDECSPWVRHWPSKSREAEAALC